MLYTSTIVLVLGLTVNCLSACVYLTIVKTPIESTNSSASDLQNCTSSAHKCCLTLNELGAELSNFDTLSISFEESSDVFLLHTQLKFQNYRQLEINGSPSSEAIVDCNSLNGSLIFTNVTNFFASNIIFDNCGHLHNHPKDPSTFLRSALLFSDCENIRLMNLTVQKSTGFGLSMFDSKGDVNIECCLFRNNSAQNDDTDTGGGGVYLEVTSGMHSGQAETTMGLYELINCTFQSNVATTVNVYPGKDQIRTFGQGGGLLISFKRNASSHHFNLTNCKFLNNTAVWGGGLHIFLTDSSNNNTILITDSLFGENMASAGGGGMVVYMVSHTSCILANNITVVSSNYSKNKAESQGGGTIIHSLISVSTIANCDADNNIMRFESCTWDANIAGYSGAIDINTRSTITEPLSTVPVFSNCTFQNNSILKKSLNGKYDEKTAGKAAMIVLGSAIEFEECVQFIGNSGTALYAIASEIKFLGETKADFRNNHGRNGGAIALLSSSLILSDQSNLTFTNNTADELGGAIYYESQGEHDLHENVQLLSCFMHCEICKNVTLIFENNSANSNFEDKEAVQDYSFGESIYAQSLLSCVSHETVTKLTNNTTNISALLEEIADFRFIGSDPHDEVVSSVASFTLLREPEVDIIPGKEFAIPLVSTDKFGHILQSDYKVFLPDRICGITIDGKYTYLPKNTLKLYGDPGTECTITIERDGNRLFYLSFNITMVRCPPGYILTKSDQMNKSVDKNECTCATYEGISQCNERVWDAKILHYYWLGYESENVSNENLVSAYCPLSYCAYNTPSYAYEHTLPSIADKSILDQFMCRDGRTGKICGSCKANYSVYFHSPNFLCKENHLCSVGWLFYLLSETLTLALLFTVILWFNISFTKGALNGFIFFAQIIDVLSVSTKSIQENFSESATKLSIFIYRFFNLDFFHLDELSFCLWEGATTLDMITMKYVTIVLAFALVFGVFIFMNLCTFEKVRYFSKKLQQRQSAIHGISTFLVICFAQTVEVTFYITAPVRVTRRGHRGIASSYQVMYNGDLEWFGAEHYKYLIPGLALFAVIVAVPTFFLMCYPLGFKALHRCGVNETCITKLHKTFCIIRLRPFFDSFQGCYKDRYRCFAGLYFIYRIMILATYSFSIGGAEFYVIIQIQVTLILLIHCLTHPYKQKVHNVLDALLFTNIAIINGLSIVIHIKSKQPFYGQFVNVVSAFQTILIGLPLILLLLCIVVKVVLKSKVCRNKKVVQDDLSLEDIPFRLIENNDSEKSSEVFPSEKNPYAISFL